MLQLSLLSFFFFSLECLDEIVKRVHVICFESCDFFVSRHHFLLLQANNGGLLMATMEVVSSNVFVVEQPILQLFLGIFDLQLGAFPGTSHKLKDNQTDHNLNYKDCAQIDEFRFVKHP